MGPDVSDIDGVARRYGRLIERHVFSRIRCERLAEDLRQEVLLRAWLRPPVVQCEAQLRAWLLQVADNLVIDVVRSPASRPVVTLHDLELARPASDRAAVIDARDAFAALRSGDRRAVMMHACGYSLAEIGDALRISEEAARKRVARARGRLRHTLTASEPESERAAA